MDETWEVQIKTTRPGAGWNSVVESGKCCSPDSPSVKKFATPEEALRALVKRINATIPPEAKTLGAAPVYRVQIIHCTAPEVIK